MMERPARPTFGRMSTPLMRQTLEEIDPQRRDSHLALVAALRELNLAGATTEMDADQLDRTTAEVIELTRLLAQDASRRVVRPGMLEPLACAVAGAPLPVNALNPSMIGVDVLFDHETLGAAGVTAIAEGGDPTGFTARAELTVNALNEGPRDSVHGGTSAFLMDCLLGVLVQATGIPCVTGTLDLRYLRRTPLDEPVTLSARISSRDGRKIYTEGEISHGDLRTVEARGLFIALPEQPTRP